ncbi:beta-hydroxyacyl-ACP dehydratase [Rubripirellula sp.]|nr:3-hydroxyacyl-ACP dehydratase FabZ family protein [Rubripirellula sp.]MDB4644841.1 beta-hydroxyacyl-ACP dehydratase [Rubripirellula sp.]
MSTKQHKPLHELDAKVIQEYQQNRHPLLFIDYIHLVNPGSNAIGFKNFSYNEWFFPAHFADEPNVPGFVQIEALTQMFLMTFLTLPGNKGKKTGFVAIENAKFKRKIIPGDRLDIEASLASYRRGLAKGTVAGTVNNQLACSAELVIAIPDIMITFTPD